MSLFISPISKIFLRIGHHLEVVKTQNLKTFLEYVGLGFLGLCLILLFSPAKTWLQEGFFALDDAVRLTFDLIGFSLLLLFLGLFLEALTSPLEARSLVGRLVQSQSHLCRGTLAATSTTPKPSAALYRLSRRDMSGVHSLETLRPKFSGRTIRGFTGASADRRQYYALFHH